MTSEFVPDTTAFSQLLHNKPLDIICLADAPWNYTLWTNRQYAVSTLAKIYPQARVLYLEPASFFWRTGYPNRAIWPSGAQVIQSNRGPSLFCKEVQERIWVIHLPLPVPARSIRKVRSLFPVIQQSLVWLARQAMGALDYKHPILWTYTPYGGWHVGRFGEVFRIYEAVDDHAAAPFYAWDRNRMFQFEQRLIRDSDVFFTVSQSLSDMKTGQNPHTHTVGNPANYCLFAQAQNPSKPAPTQMAKLERHPILGFYGALASYKISPELLATLAVQRPNYQIVLIGQAADDKWRPLEAYGNIHFWGPVPQTELVDLVAYCDVMLMPYKVNDYTVSSKPLKILEYFSTGKPVASTFIPSDMDHNDLIHFGEDTAAFIRAVDAAVADTDADKRTQRIQIARQFTWEHKVYRMLEIMKQHGLLEHLD